MTAGERWQLPPAQTSRADESRTRAAQRQLRCSFSPGGRRRVGPPKKMHENKDHLQTASSYGLNLIEDVSKLISSCPWTFFKFHCSVWKWTPENWYRGSGKRSASRAPCLQAANCWVLWFLWQGKHNAPPARLPQRQPGELLSQRVNWGRFISYLPVDPAPKNPSHLFWSTVIVRISATSCGDELHNVITCCGQNDCFLLVVLTLLPHNFTK